MDKSIGKKLIFRCFLFFCLLAHYHTKACNNIVSFTIDNNIQQYYIFQLKLIQ